MIGGYAGKLLNINLSNRKIKDKDLEIDLARDFIGGYGIGSRVIYNIQRAGVDPFEEESVFAVLTGPLTGTGLPFTSRFTVVGKSPLTGCWGDANGRGYFGPLLKFSGYDGIFIEGISEKPIYLLISKEKVEICDAVELWGRDTYSTEDYIKDKYGKKAEIICIGPSGENLSKISAVITAKGKAAARSGLAAIMGSKKLKGIVVLGGGKLEVSNPELVNSLRKKYINQLKNGVGFSEMYSSTGTPGYIEAGAINGDSPVKNWFGIGLEELKDIKEYRFEYIEQYITKRGTCYKCPMGDWKHVMVKDGPYALKEEAHMPEYETSSAFGSYCLNTNYESIIKCNDICNRFGVDTISAGATVAFAINCYEEGIITKKDTDGVELTWGNHSAIVTMTEKLAKGEGFGKILSNGIKEAAKLIGSKSEKYAIHIGGQELPAHDPRFEPSMASIYKNDATPGRHGQASQYCVPPKLAELMPDIDFSFSFGNKRDIFTGRAKAQKILSALNHCVNSMGMCLWGYLSTEVTYMPECYSAVTGWKVDLNELLKTGERIGDMRLAFTIREGIYPSKLKFPEIAIGKPPLGNGPTKGITVDIDLLTREFYNEMDWDLETGIPNKNKLKKLNLKDLIVDLWK